MKWNAIVIPLFALAACADKPPGVVLPPAVAVQPVDKIVQRPCADSRKPAADYPDTDARLAAIPQHDYEQLFKVARAGRDLRDARLAIDDVQIASCASP